MMCSFKFMLDAAQANPDYLCAEARYFKIYVLDLACALIIVGLFVGSDVVIPLGTKVLRLQWFNESGVPSDMLPGSCG